MRKLYFFGLLTMLTVSFADARDKQPGWAQLGTGSFCDDMFSVISDDYLDTWDVDIEESEKTPGYYRLVNPFGNGNCPYFDGAAFNGNDLYIHAEDPEYVWIEVQDLGFSVGDYGSVALSCMVGLYIESEVFTLEELKDPDLEIEFGKLRDGKITMSDHEWYRLQFSMRNYLEGLPANANLNNRFLVTLPDQSGVDSPIADYENGPIEYYNLQGVRVESPTGAGIYIRRQGAVTTKVVVR